MSTCSFSSYLSARASLVVASATADRAPASASGPAAVTAPASVHARSLPHNHHHHHHPLEHVAPSPSLSDAGSPFKRQRNRSPDSAVVVVPATSSLALPTPESASVAAGDDSLSASVTAASYFTAFHPHHGPPPSGLAPPTPSSSPLHTPLLAPVPKSILCLPSSPIRYAHSRCGPNLSARG